MSKLQVNYIHEERKNATLTLYALFMTMNPLKYILGRYVWAGSEQRKHSQTGKGRLVYYESATEIIPKDCTKKTCFVFVSLKTSHLNVIQKMDIRDYSFQRLGSPEIEKSGVDYKASGLSQPLNGRWKTDHFLRCWFN